MKVTLKSFFACVCLFVCFNFSYVHFIVKSHLKININFQVSFFIVF